MGFSLTKTLFFKKPSWIYGLLLTKPTETHESDGKNRCSQNEKDVAEPNCKKKNIKDTVSYRSTTSEDCVFLKVSYKASPAL